MGKSTGPSQQTQNTENQISQGQLALAQDQQSKSDQLFNLTEPGLVSASNYEKLLSSGDPNSIFRAIAPSAQNIAQQTQATKQSITQNMPRGGEQNLALSEADIAKSGQIGQLESSAYNNSFAAQASLASGGIGLSVNEVANAIAAFGGASNTQANIGNQQAAGKAAQLGFFGALAGAGGEAAAMA